MRKVELTDAIESVREQLSALARRTADKDVLFEVDTVELEFTVQVGLTGESGAKVKLWVVEAGAKAELTNETTQAVKVTLTPKMAATGRRPEVGDTEGSLRPRPSYS
ncbi:trypco2 family protein [Streptomyces sp. NPDC024017]|uniref:trypco2 family protein n=1 Tax=Streptomyces sp. NPDC024017 TaxID=3154326 RepID=UPI0033D2E29C